MLDRLLSDLSNVIAMCVINVGVDAPHPFEGTVADSPVTVPFTNMDQSHWAKAVKLWRKHGAQLIDSLPGRKCPACGRDRQRHLFVSHDGYPFAECRKCGCWFVPKVIDGSLFDAFFQRCPAAKTLQTKIVQYRLADTKAQADIRRFRGYLDEARSVVQPGSPTIAHLDVGCGVGHSLIASKALGFDPVVGIEVDPVEAAAARSKGLSVVSPGQELPPQTFGLISFWETLEHIAQPLDAMKRYTRHLADGGILHLTVPNQNSPVVRLLRGDCAYVHGGSNEPGHMNLFSPTSLRVLLDRAGLSILDVDAEYSNNPYDLFSYLLGLNHGASDLLSEDRVHGLPPTARLILDTVWPAIALVERLNLSAPILKVIACKRGEESRFSAVIQAHQQRRSEEIRSKAQALLPENVEFTLDVITSLQHEVNVRDELLRELQASLERENKVRDQRNVQLQAEVDRRDKMLADLQATLHREVGTRDELLRELQATLEREEKVRDQRSAYLQAEVDRRDRMLADLQATLHREVGTRDELLRELQATLEREIKARDALNAHLQGEVNRRDDMLQELQATLQREVEIRDGMLREQQQTLQEEVRTRDAMLRERDGVLAALQGEINLRDQMLADLRSKLNAH